MSCFLRRAHRWPGVPTLPLGVLAVGFLSPKPQNRHSGMRLGTGAPGAGKQAAETLPREEEAVEGRTTCELRLPGFKSAAHTVPSDFTYKTQILRKHYLGF